MTVAVVFGLGRTRIAQQVSVQLRRLLWPAHAQQQIGQALGRGALPGPGCLSEQLHSCGRTSIERCCAVRSIDVTRAPSVRSARCVFYPLSYTNLTQAADGKIEPL
jgi:hypothetical protein